MTVQNPAIFLQAGSHPAEDVRRFIDALLGTNANEGVLGLNDLVVSEKSGTPDMSVDVAGGRCFIQGTENTYQGAYFCDNRGVTNLAIAAADPTNPRIDVVVAKVQDSDYSGATDAWSLAVVEGTPAGSPSAPAIPNNSLKLAEVAVAAAASSIVDANITDFRAQVGFDISGGVLTLDDGADVKFVNNDGDVAATLYALTSAANREIMILEGGDSHSSVNSRIQVYGPSDTNANDIAIYGRDSGGTSQVILLWDESADTLTLGDDDITLVINGANSNSWTMTFSGGMTAGDGSSLDSYYYQIGEFTLLHGFWEFGSTTAITGNVLLDLPVTAASSVGAAAGLQVNLRSAGTYYAGYAQPSSTTVVGVKVQRSSGTYVDIATLSATVPNTWTTSDRITINGLYRHA